MPDEYLSNEDERVRVNDIATTLGIEQPYTSWIVRGDEIVEWTLDRRKWRNWLEAVERVAAQVGEIPKHQAAGQQVLDLPDGS